MITLEAHLAGGGRGGDIIIGLLDSVCQARIDRYQLPLRRAGLSDFHYNSAADKLCKIAVVAVLPGAITRRTVTASETAVLAAQGGEIGTDHLWPPLKSSTATMNAHHCCKGIKGKLVGTHLEKKQIKYVAVRTLVNIVSGSSGSRRRL